MWNTNWTCMRLWWKINWGLSCMPIGDKNWWLFFPWFTYPPCWTRFCSNPIHWWSARRYCFSIFVWCKLWWDHGGQKKESNTCEWLTRSQLRSPDWKSVTGSTQKNVVWGCRVTTYHLDPLQLQYVGCSFVWLTTWFFSDPTGKKIIYMPIQPLHWWGHGGKNMNQILQLAMWQVCRKGI